MRILKLIIILTIVFTFAGCSSSEESKKNQLQSQIQLADSEQNYRKISQEEAKRMMGVEDVIVLDVRTEEEYLEGHIPGAILIPISELTKRAEKELPKDKPILVYCYSGGRSKEATMDLLDLGFIQALDFGGINTWEYEIEK